MSGLSFIGSYSGIDMSTIDQLMEVERLPLKQLNTRKTSITDQQNAWKDINTKLNTLFEKIEALKSVDTFASMKATSTNEDIVSMSASNKAVGGTYRIDVKRLATSNSIIGGATTLGEDKKFIGDGSFTIKNAEGIEEYVIDIKDGDTLESIAKKINAVTKDHVNNADEKVKGSGISASVINGKLVLTDEKEGKRNIELIDGGNGTLGNLGLEENIYEGGQDSEFSVNGVLVEGKSNSISDIVEGLTINLKEVGETTVTVDTDYEKAEKAVQEFVDQYNSTMKFIEGKLAAGDPEVEGSAGTLSGDGTLMRLHSSLRGLVTASIKGTEEGEYTDISQLGVSTKDRYGELQFDAKKFSEALLKDPSKVANFFGTDEESGYASIMNGRIDAFISDKNGIIKSKNEAFDSTLKDINRRIEDFEVRMVKKEERLIKQFTALDVAMMQAESQMSWLSGQINAMNGVKN